MSFECIGCYDIFNDNLLLDKHTGKCHIYRRCKSYEDEIARLDENVKNLRKDVKTYKKLLNDMINTVEIERERREMLKIEIYTTGDVNDGQTEQLSKCLARMVNDPSKYKRLNKGDRYILTDRDFAVVNK